MRFGFLRLTLILAAAAAALPAAAADAVKIGLIVPMTGGQASTGKQLANAVQLYIKQHGDTVANRKIEVILRDDAANPETTKRLAHGNRKERLSLRGISSRLAEMGYVTSHSTPFSAAQISRLLKG